MSAKRWCALFLASALLIVLALIAFNVYTDPFGVFDDKFFTWYSYNMTNNPRVAKIGWLEDKELRGKYDSFIVGASSTSSISAEKLSAYTGGDFYNMIVYGADMLDSEQFCDYLIDSGAVDNLVLNMSFSNGLDYGFESDKLTGSMHAKADGSFLPAFYLRYLLANPQYGAAKLKSLKTDTYLPQAFDVFNVETGSYDKTARDAEPISDMASYLLAYPEFADYTKRSFNLTRIDDSIDSLKRIVSRCEQEEISLTVIMSPIYSDNLNYFTESDVKYMLEQMALVTDYWDFSYSSVSFDARYFYDETHFRNSVGDMMLARLYDDDSLYVPDDFGVYVTNDNIEEYLESYYDIQPLEEDEYTTQVPILMYHHLTEDPSEADQNTITVDSFKRQMEQILEMGYTPVSVAELEDYVYSGVPLPDNPIAITFDDGYESNYTLAYPVLKELGIKATIFVIGSSVGAKETYKDTDYPITPHFNYDEAIEMVESGLISIQSHTYDMHQWAPYESGDTVRESAIQLGSETDYEFAAALREDIEKSRSEIEAATREAVKVLAYPNGKYDTLSQAVLNSMGVTVTLSTNPGINTLIQGLPQSLYGLKRYSVSDATDLSDIIS